MEVHVRFHRDRCNTDFTILNYRGRDGWVTVTALISHQHELCTLCTTDTMPKGISILESTCWAVVRMHTCRFSPEQIKLMTDVSPCQQHHILKHLRKTDNVPAEKYDPRIQGKPHQMMAEDVAVSSLIFLYPESDSDKSTTVIHQSMTQPNLETLYKFQFIFKKRCK